MMPAECDWQLVVIILDSHSTKWVFLLIRPHFNSGFVQK
jgi:hypothetical protein